MNKTEIEFVAQVPQPGWGRGSDSEQLAGDKRMWAKQAQRYLRMIAKMMGLQPGDFRVDYNPGGIAIFPGDCHLHTEHVYVNIGGSYCHETFYIRGCIKGGCKAPAQRGEVGRKGGRDYGCGWSGVERNQNIPYDVLKDPERFAKMLLALTAQVIGHLDGSTEAERRAELIS